MARHNSTSTSNELEKIDQLLAQADLNGFFEPLKQIGVEKMEHLRDVTDENCNSLGMNHLERNRFARLREKSGKGPGRFFSIAQKLMPKPKAKAIIVSSTDPAPVSPLRPCMPPWSIPEHGIAPDRILCGSFGDIGCIQDGNLVDSNGSSVPVRLLTIDSSCRRHRAFAQRASTLFAIRENNIVRFFGVGTCGRISYVAMEHCPEGSLSEELLRRGVSFPLMELYDKASQIARGLRYLEEREVVHGNLRASSVFLSPPGVCKVGGFSLMHAGDVVKYITDGGEGDRARARQKDRIPYQWAPPEVFQTHIFTPQSVVWSYGALLWEMFSHGLEPWAAMTTMDIWTNITDRKNRLAKPCHCPEDIYSLMLRCWSEDPGSRPLFKGLESLIIECYPQQAVAICSEEISGDNSAGMLTLSPGDKLTIVNKQPTYWFGQNNYGYYGEFRCDCVRISPDSKGPSPAPARDDGLPSRTSSDGKESADISNPMNVKQGLHISDIHNHTEEELKKLIEEEMNDFKRRSSLSVPNERPAHSQDHLPPVPGISPDANGFNLSPALPAASLQHDELRANRSPSLTSLSSELPKLGRRGGPLPVPAARHDPLPPVPTPVSAAGLQRGGLQAKRSPSLPLFSSELRNHGRRCTTGSSQVRVLHVPAGSGASSMPSVAMIPEGNDIALTASNSRTLLDDDSSDSDQVYVDMAGNDGKDSSDSEEYTYMKSGALTGTGENNSVPVEQDGHDVRSTGGKNSDMVEYTPVGPLLSRAASVVSQATQQEPAKAQPLRADSQSSAQAAAAEAKSRPDSMLYSPLYNQANRSSAAAGLVDAAAYVEQHGPKPTPRKRQRKVPNKSPQAPSMQPIPARRRSSSMLSQQDDTDSEPVFMKGKQEPSHTPSLVENGSLAAYENIGHPNPIAAAPAPAAAVAAVAAAPAAAVPAAAVAAAPAAAAAAPAAAPAAAAPAAPAAAAAGSDRTGQGSPDYVNNPVLTSQTVHDTAPQSLYQADSDRPWGPRIDIAAARQDLSSRPTLTGTIPKHQPVSDQSPLYDHLTWTPQEENKGDGGFAPKTPQLEVFSEMAAPLSKDHLSHEPSQGIPPQFNVSHPVYTNTPADPKTPPLPPKKAKQKAEKSTEDGYAQVRAEGMAASASALPMKQHKGTMQPSPLTLRKAASCQGTPPPIRHADSPMAFAQRLAQELPDLVFANILTALQTYGSERETERHLRAQLVLDVHNHLREDGIHVDFAACESAMNHCQWERDCAIKFLTVKARELGRNV